MASERRDAAPRQRDLLYEISGGRLFSPEVHTGASNDRYKLSQRLWPSDDAAPTETWAAIDFTLRRPVTVRLVDVNSEAGQRMRLQTQALARLEHPALLHILDTYSQGRRLAVVTEQVPTHTLADEVCPIAARSGGAARVAEPAGASVSHAVMPMAPAEALLVGACVAEALGALHDCGFAHGGLTAADVGRRPEGGFVILTGPPTSDAVHIPATPRADVRSLGALVHELMVGAPPLVRLDGTWEVSDQVPAPARLLIERAADATQPWPDARSVQHACTEARAALLRHQAGAPKRRRAKHRWLTSAAGVLAAAGLLTAGSLLAERMDDDAGQQQQQSASQSARSTAARSTEARSTEGGSAAPGFASASPNGGGYAATASPPGASVAAGSVAPRGATNSTDDPSYPVARVPLEIAHITDFDPAPGGDRVEHPERLRLINNGDATEGWHTESYRTADFGGLKEGVGLIVGLGQPAQADSDGTSDVAQFAISSPDVGWRFELYASTERYHALIDWGEPIAVVAAGAEPTTLLTNNVKASSLLLWITDLGAPQPDGDFSVTITRIAVERELPS